APVLDLTESKADLRRVPYLLATVLERSERFRVAYARWAAAPFPPGGARAGEPRRLADRAWRLASTLGVTGWPVSVLSGRRAATRWLLIKNPRFGDVPTEPEYIWVEEDKIPFTFTGLINKNALIAPPEIVSKYGPPPGGGKISPRQGVPTQTSAPSPQPSRTA